MAKKKTACHRDALKRARQAETRRLRNKSAIAELKTIRRGVIAATTPEEREKALRLMASALGKAASKKVIHRNRAARILSRLAKKRAK